MGRTILSQTILIPRRNSELSKPLFTKNRRVNKKKSTKL